MTMGFQNINVSSRVVLALTMVAAMGAGSAARGGTITVVTKPGTALRNVDVQFFGSAERFAAGTFEVELPNGNVFDAYCVDLFHVFTSGDSWEVDVLPIAQLQGFESNPPPVGRGGAVGWLYDQFAGSVSSNDERAALQVAIWKMVYDGPDDLDFGSGNFVFTPTSGTQLNIRNLADSYLSAFTPGDASLAAWLRATSHPNGRHQDLVTSVEAIPEPSALLMAGGGLFVVIAGTLRHRRRSAGGGTERASVV
jgi:hypothetical protein